MVDTAVQCSLFACSSGIFYALSIVGPGVGFLVAGSFLAFYTDFGVE